MEVERNKNLLLLVNSLINKGMIEEVLMVGNIIKTDTISMKKSFSIIVNGNCKDDRILYLKEGFDQEIEESREDDKKSKNRGCCDACGEGYDNEEEWKYNTKCGCCGSPIPKHLIIKKK
jgi:hypothetical protein